jgi:diguanylate cyclase (GGDEF)-like protein/PAS domain S-box-containing protein
MVMLCILCYQPIDVNEYSAKFRKPPVDIDKIRCAHCGSRVHGPCESGVGLRFKQETWRWNLAMTNRILVVDDEELNLDLCVRRLQRKGFSMQAAKSAREAMEILQTADFDLVLLDQMMPGMSGLELLKLLRATYSQQDLPIIMVTAVADSASIAQALEMGANDYITKPIDFSVAIARVRSQLASKHAITALRQSEERYALAATGANDGLWDWDIEAGKTYYSPRWKQLLGWNDEEISEDPKEWTSRIHPGDLLAFESALDKHLNGITPAFECDYRMLHRDLSYRWVASRGLAVRNAEGKPVRMAGSQSDVTAKVTRDALTGLPNRLLLEDRLQAALEHSRTEPNWRFALCFLDVDRFKLINDTMGHIAGDRLIQEVATRLRTSLRDGEVSGRSDGDSLVARLGGDEFAILLEGVRCRDQVEKIGERIARSMRPPLRYNDNEIYCSISVGMVLSQLDYESTEEILCDADTAMYAAKAMGGGRWAVFEESMRNLLRLRVQTESDLRRALERNELRVHYQPRVFLESGEILGFEALVRWQHPARGLLSPIDFIPAAEETGLIVEIGLWVIRAACRQTREWQLRFPQDPPLDVAVNLSVRQCRDPKLAEAVAKILEETGLAPACLNLELTESLLFEDLAQARSLLNSLKTIGVGLKIDDFGTGYSCLRYLCELPFDAVKIDRSFTRELLAQNSNSAETAIVRSIVSMAESLKMGVIAEGIENATHVKELLAMGCRFGQGYFFSRPVDATESTALLARSRTIRQERVTELTKGRV